MMMTQPPPSKPQTLFEQSVRQALPGPLALVGEPPWLQDLRHRSMARFEILGLPTRRQELWRYVDLNPILDGHFEPFQSAPQLTEDVSHYVYEEAKASRLVFANGFFQEQLSDVSGLPENVLLQRLSDAVKTHGTKLKSYLAPSMETEADAFVALNTASFQDAAVLYIPEGVSVAQPIEILFYTKGDPNVSRLAYPRILVIAEANSQADVLVSYVGCETTGSTNLNQAVSEIYVGKGANIHYTHLQAKPRDGVLLAATQAFVEEKGQLAVKSFSFGAGWARHYLTTTLNGEKAHCTLNGLAVLNGTQQMYDHTVIEHAVPNSTSEQLYKGILQGSSKSEFDGTIVIRKGAQQTDAAQLNQNLLLSEDAKVITRPQLKIDADDVKCTHGATVGQLSDAELFYLRSRGLSMEQSKALLTFGFSETIIETVPMKSLRLQLRDMAIRSLSKGSTASVCK